MKTKKLYKFFVFLMTMMLIVSFVFGNSQNVIKLFANETEADEQEEAPLSGMLNRAILHDLTKINEPSNDVASITVLDHGWSGSAGSWNNTGVLNALIAQTNADVYKAEVFLIAKENRDSIYMKTNGDNPIFETHLDGEICSHDHGNPKYATVLFEEVPIIDYGSREKP